MMGLVKKFVPKRSRLVSYLTETFSYPQLVGARVCLGVAEAGLFPGVVY